MDNDICIWQLMTHTNTFTANTYFSHLIKLDLIGL